MKALRLIATRRSYRTQNGSFRPNIQPFCPHIQRCREASGPTDAGRSPGGWRDELRAEVGDRGFDAAVNAVPNGAASMVDPVREGGRLVTITSDPPPEQRGVAVQEVYVAPDGARLQRLTAMLAAGTLPLPVAAAFPLGSAKDAFAHVLRGTDGSAIVVGPALEHGLGEEVSRQLSFAVRWIGPAFGRAHRWRSPQLSPAPPALPVVGRTWPQWRPRP